MIIFERVVAELGMQDGCITPLIGLAIFISLFFYFRHETRPVRNWKNKGWVVGETNNALLVDGPSRAVLEDTDKLHGPHIAMVKPGLYAISQDWAAAQELAAHPERAQKSNKGFYVPDRTGVLQKMMEGSDHNYHLPVEDKTHAVDRSVDAMRRSISLTRGGLPFGFQGNENNPQHLAEYINALYDAGYEEEAKAIAKINRKTLQKGGRNG